MSLLLDRDFVNLGDNWLEIERLYAFDWQKFQVQDWQALHETYQNLPHFLGYDTLPHWFGKSSHSLPHLWASVVPKGLLVSGILPLKDWLLWENIWQEKLEQWQMKMAKN
ncbi:MAG: hypothetical protein MUE85_06960 [Microscillaceae bacterium]|jgi:hypothetical protein|nr:hypothetical protein [Microscillaceae bacterium]